MTELCERCQARLGELLQWEVDHPAAVALTSSVAPVPASAAIPARPAASRAAQLDGVAAPMRARFVSRPVLSTSPTLAEVEAEQPEATPQELSELWQHAQSCPECKDDLALLRSARQVLAVLPQQTPPSDLRARIRAQLAPATSSTLAHATSAEAAGINPSKLPAHVAADRAQAKAQAAQPWWKFWSFDRAAFGRNAAPRVVWAGAGVAVAAFCAILALQLKTRPFNPGVSEADSSRSSGAASSAPAASGALNGAPGASAIGAGKAPSSTSRPLGSSSQASPLQKAAGKAAGGSTSTVPASTPGAPRASGVPAKPKTSESAARTQLPKLNRDGGFPGGLPDMPAVPGPPALAPLQSPRRQALEAVGQAQNPNRHESAERKADNQTQSAGKTSQGQLLLRSRVAEPTTSGQEAASIRVQVAPVPVQGLSLGNTRLYVSGGMAGRSLASGSETAGASTQDNGPASKNNMASAGAPGREDENGSRGASDSSAIAGGLADSDETRLKNTPRRTRQMSQSAAPQAPEPPNREARGPLGPTGPVGSAGSSSSDAAAPSLASPAPASGGFGGGGGFGGFGGSVRARAGSSGAATEPRASSATGNGTSFDASPRSSASRGDAPVRQVIVEIKARRAFKRAQVEVVLAEGWLFAQGTGPRRVLWTGPTKAGKVILFQIELKAARPDAPLQAARVLLLNTSGAHAIESSSAAIVIPASSTKR